MIFLKPYIGLLNNSLADILNGNIHMLMFIGVTIDPAHPL